MKKYGLLAILVIALLATSCKKEEDKQETPQQEEVLTFVGRWMTEDGGYYEVYNDDGTGKFWTPADDVQEEEAQTFTWEMDPSNPKVFIQYHKMEIGDGIVPQVCNILELTKTKFRYNNEGLRAEYNLIRVQ